MGLASAGSVIKPSASELIGKPENVVTPNAITAMSDAFRSGYITADDIMKRTDELGQAKRKTDLATVQLQERQAKDAMDNQTLAMATAKSKMEHDKAITDLGPGGTTIQAMFQQAGIPIPMVESSLAPGTKSVDMAKVNEFTPKILEWASEEKRKAAEHSGWEPKEVINPKGELVQKYYNKYSGKLGDVMPSSGAETFFDWNTRKASGSLGTPQAASSLVSPQPASPLVLKPGPGDTKFSAPTEVQQRDLNAIPRFNQSNAMMADLQKAGFDAAGIQNLITGNLPNIFKPESRQKYEAAKTLWLQGLLRLESGAAISKHEEEWYGNAFFPVTGDSLEVMQAKKTARDGVEQSVRAAASAGNLSPEIKGMASNTVPGGGGAQAPSAAVSAPPGVARSVAIPGVGFADYDASNRRIGIRRTLAPAVAAAKPSLVTPKATPESVVSPDFRDMRD
jgi:hypothetical protein